MKNYTLILLAALFAFFSANAQSNFKPGYIVTLNGDTTRGFIDYKEWNENPQRVSFKTSAEASVQQYTPVEIAAFGADMLDNYRSYTGAITKGNVDLRELSIGIDSSNINGSFFLRTIASGKNLSFYSYDDRIKSRYFISEKNGTPVELKRYVYLDIKQSDKIREYNFYTQQLLAYAIKYQPDNAALEATINKVAYDAGALLDVVLRLDGTIATNKVRSISRGGHRFFVGAGVNFVKESFSRRKFFSAMDGIFNTNTQVNTVVPTITGGIDLYFNKNVGKLLFRTEGNFSVNQIKASYKGSIFDGFREIGGEEDLSANQVTLGVNPQIIYNVYNAENFKFFIGIGANFAFSKYFNERFRVRSYFNGNLEKETDFKVPYRALSTNLSGRMGITLKDKIEVYAGYYMPASITAQNGYGIDVSFYRFGVNYLFGKK